mmetsp:Transcript_132984/g.425345  ORF Transcript_132984/g.425345 Transcript_132984/m.425345 type:complete len:393 (+) Transcript_132984:442-1620(+)
MGHPGDIGGGARQGQPARCHQPHEHAERGRHERSAHQPRQDQAPGGLGLDRPQDHGSHGHLAQGLLQCRDDIVEVPLFRAAHLGDDFLAALREVVERQLVVGAGPRIEARVVRGVDLREVLPTDDLGERPTQSAIGTCKVHAVVQLVHLIEHNQELVVQSRERFRQHLQGLSGGTWLVGVEEEEDQIGTLRPPAHDVHEVVASPSSGVAAEVVAVDGARQRQVDHSWRIHDLQTEWHDSIICQQLPLPAEVAGERLPKALQFSERPVPRTTEDRGPILGGVRLPSFEHREAIVCRGDTGLLRADAQQPVDECRLSGGVVTDDEHHRNEGEGVQVVLEGATRQSLVDGHNDLILDEGYDLGEIRLGVCDAADDEVLELVGPLELPGFADGAPG